MLAQAVHRQACALPRTRHYRRSSHRQRDDSTAARERSLHSCSVRPPKLCHGRSMLHPDADCMLYVCCREKVYHGSDRVCFDLDLASGAVSISAGSTTVRFCTALQHGCAALQQGYAALQQGWHIAHGILMVVSWGLLLPSGVIMERPSAAARFTLTPAPPPPPPLHAGRHTSAPRLGSPLPASAAGARASTDASSPDAECCKSWCRAPMVGAAMLCAFPRNGRTAPHSARSLLQSTRAAGAAGVLVQVPPGVPGVLLAHPQP
jgi:hypothetical protein